MKYIKGQNRQQASLFPVSLEDSVDPENEVRLIDFFVDSLYLGDLGFKVEHTENGRPAYHPADLLKLYIYILKTDLRKKKIHKLLIKKIYNKA